MMTLKALLPLAAVLMLNACGGNDKSQPLSDNESEQDMQNVRDIGDSGPNEIQDAVRNVEEVAGDTPEEMAKKREMMEETAEEERAKIEDDMKPDSP